MWHAPNAVLNTNINGENKMIAEWLIEKNKLVLYTTRGITVYVNEKGEVHQGRVLFFVGDVPMWRSDWKTI